MVSSSGGVEGLAGISTSYTGYPICLAEVMIRLVSHSD